MKQSKPNTGPIRDIRNEPGTRNPGTGGTQRIGVTPPPLPKK